MNRRGFCKSLAMVPAAAIAMKVNASEACATASLADELPEYMTDALRSGTGKTVVLKNVKLAFPNLFEEGPIGTPYKPRYGATFLLPKGHPSTAELRSVIAKTARTKWGTVFNYKTCLKRGYVRASSLIRPVLVDRNRSTLVEADNKLRPGCRVNAQIAVWPTDAGGQRRVCAQLRGVQFVR